MELHITLTRSGDMSLQIYRHILAGVLDGRLRDGERMPPTRELAKRLDVSRNTVSVAYELLTAEGILAGRVGAGSFISSQPTNRVQERHAPAGVMKPLGVWQTIPGLLRARTISKPFEYDFGVGVPDSCLFPVDVWRRLVSAQITEPKIHNSWRDAQAGYAGLRSAIARHIGVSRAVQAHPDDVIVTNGAQQAFDLIGKVFLTKRTCVAVEEPGYLYVRLLFQSMGADVTAVGVDEEGLRVDDLPENARLVYVTPSHQFPMGVTMSLKRRMQLLAWAERRNAVIIEDDYDSEFRYDGRPLDPLQGLDRSGRVIYVGSFSKVMMPALRLGFLVAPASLQPALKAAKQLTDWHCDMATQAALAKFIDSGLLARHIRKISRAYAERYRRIAELLEGRFANWVRPTGAPSGLHLAAESVRKTDFARVVENAEARGVRVHSLASFQNGKAKRHGLLIGFGAIPTARIDEGMRRLEECFA